MSVLYCMSLSFELRDDVELLEAVEFVDLVCGAQMPPVVTEEAGDDPDVLVFRESQVCVCDGNRLITESGPVARRITTLGAEKRCFILIINSINN